MMALALIVFGSRAAQAMSTCESVFRPVEVHSAAEPELEKRLDRIEQLIGQSSEFRAERGELDDEALAKTMRASGRDVLSKTDTRWGQSVGGELDLISVAGKSVLNRLARQIEKAYGASLIIWPEHLVVTGGRAGIVDVTFSGKKTSMLLLGASGLKRALTGRDLLRDISVLHELRHLKVLSQLKNKEPGAFYGNILAISGRIRDVSHPDFMDYSTYLSFDECLTFHQQAKQAILELRRRSQAGAAQSEIDSAMESLGSTISTGYVITDRTRQTGELIKNFATVRTMDYESDEGGLVTAKETFGISGQGKFEIEIPLIQSRSAQDPHNQAHLMQQLDQMITKSSLASQQFHDVLRLFLNSQKQSKNGQIGIADLDRMQTLLNPSALKP